MPPAFEVRGWTTAPPLDLDHRRFSYAGHFRLPSTGKVVATDDGDIVGAAAVSEDRTDPETLRIRYLSVRRDRRGERIGPQLAAFIRHRARNVVYERTKAGVNNPIAYEAFYRAGFVYTGNRTGIETVVVEAPPVSAPAGYRAGLGALAHTDLPAHQRAVFHRGLRRGAPPLIEAPGH